MAGNERLRAHVFRGAVVFLAINVDNVPAARAVADVVAGLPALAHFSMGDAAVRAFQIQFVPNRLILARDGTVAHWWNGTHGNVVDGRHGASRANGSSHLVETLSALLRA